MSVTEWIDGVLMDRKKKCRFGGHVKYRSGWDFFFGGTTLCSATETECFLLPLF